MNPRRLIAGLLVAVSFSGTGLVLAAEDDDSTVHVHVRPGEGPWQVAQRLCPDHPGPQYTELLEANPWLGPYLASGAVLHPGAVLHWDPSTCPAPPTTTSTSATTTEPATTTTTEPGTTTTAAPTTVSPTTTTVVEPTLGFLEDFNGNADALERFRWGVHHRDTDIVTQTEWTADHDLLAAGDCTPPTQGHTVHRADTDAALYVCGSVGGDPNKGHLMTTMGDVSGYSLIWFSPDQIFVDETVVSWDVNVTDELVRKWWDVAIVPIDDPDEMCVDLDTSDNDFPPCSYPNETTFVNEHYTTGGEIPAPSPEAIMFGNGPLGGEITYTVDGVTTHPYPFGPGICGPDGFELDAEGCASIAIRRHFSITENAEGTITFAFGERTWTVPGQFPEGEWKVVFTDHNYTPIKDGQPVSLTWHWDAIAVTG